VLLKFRSSLSSRDGASKKLGEGGRKGEVGRRGKLWGKRWGLKNPWAREEDVFLVHPQNSLNSLILNWCTCGCWFTPAIAED